MRPEVPHAQKLEAAQELKTLAKTASDGYWQKNCAQVRQHETVTSSEGLTNPFLRPQILSVLLESFSNSSGRGGSPSLEGEDPGPEDMHLTAKMLQLLVRYRGAHVKVCRNAADYSSTH